MHKDEPENGQKKTLLLERAKRLKQVRKLTSYKITQFEREFGFSKGYIGHMENVHDNFIISQRIAERISSAVEIQGFIVNVEWLLYGTGEPPYRLKPKLKPQVNFFCGRKTTDELEQLITKFTDMIGKEYLPMLVTDDAMEPMYQKDDWVIGVPVDPIYWKELKGEHCIAEFTNQKKIIRTFDLLDKNKVALLCKNLKTTQKEKHLFNAEITNLYQIFLHLKSGQT